MFEDDLGLLAQALRNVGNTFGGRSRLLLHAVAKEIKRLQRAQEQQEHKERMAEYKDKAKQRKIMDDDIPF